MKILIVEDEKLLSDSLKKLLEKKNYEIECVYNGDDGFYYARTGIYDLIIMDVMMPKRNGYEATKAIRSSHCSTPILMLTARSELDDEIEGLDAGADYYLTKPFDSRRLLACINAILRRQGTQVEELSIGNTLLNLSNSMLSTTTGGIRLSSKEFDVMRYLMSSYGQILSKEKILCKVWGYDSNAVENNVEVYVGLLRKKLKYINSDIRICAIRRLGYSLEVQQSC